MAYQVITTLFIYWLLAGVTIGGTWHAVETRVKRRAMARGTLIGKIPKIEARKLLLEMDVEELSDYVTEDGRIDVRHCFTPKYQDKFHRFGPLVLKHEWSPLVADKAPTFINGTYAWRDPEIWEYVGK